MVVLTIAVLWDKSDGKRPVVMATRNGFSGYHCLCIIPAALRLQNVVNGSLRCASGHQTPIWLYRNVESKST